MEIRIREDKCNRCMRCVRDCIAAVIREKDGKPYVACPELCSLCSHCLAVCPKGAVVHTGLDRNHVRKINKKLIDPDTMREIILSRRSVRNYKDKPVPEEMLRDIIEVARCSPTAGNTQHVRYTVITDRELLRKVSERILGFGDKLYNFLKSDKSFAVKKIMEQNPGGASFLRYMDMMNYYKKLGGRDLILHGAPALILLRAPRGASFACANCNIAAANITNYAHALGLGACYIGLLVIALKTDKKLRNWLDVPGDERVHQCLTLGYPAIKYTHTAARKQPVVRWIVGRTSVK